MTMARGWESKSVEAQIEEADSEANSNGSKRKKESPEVRNKREGLILQRTRIIQEMETARNDRYRTMLSEVLHHLEVQLAELRNT